MAGNLELRQFKGVFATTGEIEVQAGRTFLVGADTVMNQAGADLSGTGTIALGGGSLVNQGTVNSSLRAMPRIGGTGVFESTGTIHVALGGLQPAIDFDRLVIETGALIGGTIALSLVDGYQPQLGDSYIILRGLGGLQFFGTFSGLDIGGGLGLEAAVVGTDLQLVVVEL